MTVHRTVGGWVLRLGLTARKFKRLADIWELISPDDWCLSDIFPKDKLIDVKSIKPPKPRKVPTEPDKRTHPLRDPRDIMQSRVMARVRDYSVKSIP